MLVYFLLKFVCFVPSCVLFRVCRRVVAVVVDWLILQDVFDYHRNRFESVFLLSRGLFPSLSLLFMAMGSYKLFWLVIFSNEIGMKVCVCFIVLKDVYLVS